MSDLETALEFDSAALITFDTQRDFLDGGASPIRGTSAVLPAMCELVEGFRAAGRPIVHIVRLYERDGSNAELCRRELLAAGAELVTQDTPGAQLARELLSDSDLRLDAALLLAGGVQPLGPGEVAMYKPRWGAFYRERDFRVAVVRDALSGLYERGEQELLAIGVQLLSAREVTRVLVAHAR